LNSGKIESFFIVSSGLWKTRYRRIWSIPAKWPDCASGNGLLSEVRQYLLFWTLIKQTEQGVAGLMANPKFNSLQRYRK
jgi:hypothetical protein